MKKLCIAILSFLITAGFSQNLLTNSDFKKIDAQKNPVNWYFDNCTRNPLLIPSHEKIGGKNAAVIRVADADTPELYGYWTQIIKLEEPGKYILRFKIRTADMSFAYWLSNSDGSALTLKMFPSASGENSRKVLDKFIDSKYLVTFSAVEWREVSVEVDVPTLSADKLFSVKISAMAASSGWMAVTDVWFGKKQK